MNDDKDGDLSLLLGSHEGFDNMVGLGLHNYGLGCSSFAIGVHESWICRWSSQYGTGCGQRSLVQGFT